MEIRLYGVTGVRIVTLPVVMTDKKVRDGRRNYIACVWDCRCGWKSSPQFYADDRQALHKCPFAVESFEVEEHAPSLSKG